MEEAELDDFQKSAIAQTAEAIGSEIPHYNKADIIAFIAIAFSVINIDKVLALPKINDKLVSIYLSDIYEELVGEKHEGYHIMVSTPYFGN